MPIPTDLRAWAMRHGVTDAAISELGAILGTDAAPTTSEGSESRVQSEIRLAAPSYGLRLFRNNVGVLRNEAGTPVRYGLANESKQMNQRLKSSDLIGWRRLVITPEMVGGLVAQFASVECKHAGWTYKGDDHEQAQNRWISLAAAEGAYATFANSADQLG